MADIWFISDTHFFHDNILKFMDAEGQLIRGAKFSTVTEMNDYILDAWNSVVKPHDKVYHLGDVAVGVQKPTVCYDYLRQLHGKKRLMLGNHDHIEQIYYRIFERIELWTGGKFKQYNFVCSHIPLRPDQMRDGEYNIHGHIHQNLITHQVRIGETYDNVNGLNPLFQKQPDPKYINVCVEHTQYRPVHLDEIRAMVK
jgi:calcineurin-like phosphoesterase family protein